MYCMPEDILPRLVDAAGPELLCGGLRGIEKEALRINRRSGALAQTPHPAALGAALTHPFITTDFAESLIEFVTPTLTNNQSAIRFLEELHRFTLDHMQDEILWPCSMPCGIAKGAEIPLARYGSSNVGQMKTVYRRGLGLRYGRVMQTIAGVHFNYSLPQALWPVMHKLLGSQQDFRDFQSACYFALVRNFRRVAWLILYLFGSSPAVCKSFFQGATSGLQEVDARTLGAPYATSLRMSDIGYSNNAQAGLNISVNSMDEYVGGLTRAISTPHAPYEDIGLYDGDKRLQLSTNILQIANEYYSVIRPKRVTRSGEEPTMALHVRGVEYVEIRALDLDPFAPVGVKQQQLDFIECLLIHCLLKSSPAISPAEQVAIEHNDNLVAARGRETDLMLNRDGSTVAPRAWAENLCDELFEIADLLDTQNQNQNQNQSYRDAITRQLELIKRAEMTPSARVLQVLQEQQISYHDFGFKRAEEAVNYLQQQVDLPAQTRQAFADLAQQSHTKMQQLEDSDTESFDEYLQRYFAQTPAS